jgi:hypothetical protein
MCEDNRSRNTRSLRLAPGEEPEQAPTSVRILCAVSSLTNTRPTELPPLFESVDADALNSIVSHCETSEIRVSFSYAETVVTVYGNDEILVRTRQDE